MNIRLSLVYVIAGWAALTACGGSSAEGGSTEQGTSCSRDADCGSGYTCDFSGSETMAALPVPGARTLAVDTECYDLCEETCLLAEMPEATCASDCTDLCSDGEEPDPGTGGGGSMDPTDPTDPTIPTDPTDPSDPDPEPEPTPPQGVCRATTTDVGTGGSDGSGGSGAGTGGSDSDGTGGSTADADVEWAGNWNVDLSYTAHCDNFGNISSKSQSHTLTVQLSGSNDALTLTTGNHEMTGFGSNSGLTLNGTFPVRTSSDKDANTVKDDTRITIKLGDVQGPSSASGTIEGTYYATGFSAKCTVQDGTATFSR